MQSDSNHNDNQQLQVDIRPYDILCGRSKNCFNNIGNRRFRITIGMNVRKFNKIQSRTERGKFIATLAQTLKDDAGFRFIRISKKHGRVELSDEEVRAKIGHALRDHAKAQEEANAAVAKTAEEAKKVAGSSSVSIMEASTAPSRAATPSPLQQQPSEFTSTTMEADDQDKKPAHRIVTPQAPERQVINNDEKARQLLSPFSQDDDDISDISQEDHANDHGAQHWKIHPTREGESSTMKAIPAFPSAPQPSRELKTLNAFRKVAEDKAKKEKLLQEIADLEAKLKQMEREKANRNKPTPTPAAATDVAKAQELGDDHFCLMPLQFDEPAKGMMLDSVPMDLFANDHQHLQDHFKRAKSTCDLDSHHLSDMEDDLSYSFERRCSMGL